MRPLLVCLFLCAAATATMVLCDDPAGNSTHTYPWDTTAHVFSAQQGARYTLPVTGHFCQCNSTWGNNFMSPLPNNTRPVDKVCAQGCAMTSLSVFLRAKGVTINGRPSDPGTLNGWLRTNGGYICDPDCDDMNLPVVHKLDPRVALFGYQRTFTMEDIVRWMKLGWAAILHVENNHHFVLATGWFVGPDGHKPNGTFITRDSAFPKLTREFHEVTDVLVYSWNASATRVQ